jgi:NAD(P)-dependent dehydrogenase (short-subunit alcohol dehydrogenase family)
MKPVAIGAGAMAFALDVSESGQVDSLLAETLARLGRVDVMVANARASHGAPFLELDEATWDRVL